MSDCKLYKSQQVALVEADLTKSVVIYHNMANKAESNCDISTSEIDSED